MTYREEKVAFVTGHEGGEPGEILALMVAAGLFLVVCYLLHGVPQKATLGVAQFAVEWLCLFAAPVLLVVLPDYLAWFAALLALCVAAAALWRRDADAATEQHSHQRWAFVSAYRCCLMISTCVAILAVDFAAFPRRFAKTETFGISLMDMGVALYKSWPLLLLGGARLATVKGTDYPEHVSEYGVHWNFFFTLAAVGVVAELAARWRRLLPWLAAGYLVGYQLLLSATPLTRYVFEHERDTLLHQNREGLVSIGGYFALLVAGQLTARCLLRLPLQRPHVARRALLGLLAAGAALWLAAWLTAAYVQPPSRRLLNAAYALYVVAANVLLLLTFLFAFAVLGLLRDDDVLPALYRSVNRNQLVVFLLANLLTGAVNFSIRTLDYDFPSAVAVLLAYAAVLAAFCALTRHVSLKFW